MDKKEQCYGVILVYKEHEDMFLLLERKEKKDDWTFAKGHTEEGETPLGTALREVEEETNIKEVKILDTPIIYEEYEIKKEDRTKLKNNGYFIGYVHDKTVQIEEKEIQSYKWVTFEEAVNLFQREIRKNILKKAKEYLDNYESKR